MANRLLACAFTAIAVASAVFCSTRNGRAEAPDFNIHASGQWRGDAGGSGSWRADLAVDGNAVSGAISVIGHPELGQASISGSVSGPALDFVVKAGGSELAKFSGGINGRALVGRYTTRTGATGVWGGSWKSDGLSAPWIAAHWPAQSTVIDQNPSPSGPTEVSGGVRYAPPQYSATELSGSSAATSSSAVTVGTNALVTSRDDQLGRPQTEPEVAIDRTGMQNRVAAGANDQLRSGKNTLEYYFSTDGGMSWPSSPSLQGEIPGLAIYDKGADPGLDFDAGGRAFYSGLAFNYLYLTNNAIFVARALYGQTAYQNLVVVDSASSDSVFHDKPWVAANRLAGSPGFGNVYVCWTKLENKVGPGSYQIARVRTARSTNAGNETLPMTFDGGRFVSDGTGIGAFAGTGCSVTTDLNGDPVIVWGRGGNQIVVDTCTNGGTTCGADFPITTINPVSFLYNSQIPIRSIPSASADAVSDAYGYYIAVVWAAKATPTAINSDIYYTLFVNDHWLTPIAIASDSVDEFMPAVAFGDDQIIYVTYYKRTSQSEEKFNVYMISSASGTTFSTPVLVNDGGPFGRDPDYPFIGDYIGIDATTIRQPVWTDGRRTKPNQPTKHQDDIYTATVSGC